MFASNSSERSAKVRIEARAITERRVENGFHGCSGNGLSVVVESLCIGA
jgi:hypothetical protein